MSFLRNETSANADVANMGTNGLLSPRSSHSKLYSILKSGTLSPTNGIARSDQTATSALPSESTESIQQASPQRVDGNTIWNRAQCDFSAIDEVNFFEHQNNQSANLSDNLPGCPFCPKDEFQSCDWQFQVDEFSRHLESTHADVRILYCGYCLFETKSPVLEELQSHILAEHHLPWRASPSSLAYLRREQLPHRVLTCMGCGWCTFVLCANNAVQPPASLEDHLMECPFNGGRVNVPLYSGSSPSDFPLEELTVECDQLSQSFAQTFPLVRGYPSDTSLDTPKELTLHYRNASAPISINANAIKAVAASHPRRKSTFRKPSNKTPRVKQSRLSSKSRTSPLSALSSMEFDVPISLPPQPPTSIQKKQAPVCLYVCPLCGDNALASLRQRDEHLQSIHHGELVFPCQVCGLAYPLYIALRRHAALKHNADYDLVRYGPPELMESEPVECPKCRLVAFTDSSVLLLHLSEVHKIELEQAKNLLRADAHKATITTENTGRRGGRAPKRDSEKQSKDTTPKPKPEKRRHKAPSLSRLEVLLGQVSGEPAPMSCRLCRTAVDNAKEFKLHMELDHAETEECEQLGCQACGRIFFGPGGRIDLIGHLRVLHQDADQSSALSCPQAERKSLEKISEDGTAVHVKPCEALFSSPRLRQVHSATSSVDHPAFACPLTLELPDCENVDALDLSEQLRAAIMETECAADRDGLMILAYCCPNCSRLFAGFQAPVRFASHRLACQVEPRVVTEPAAPAPQPATEPRPQGPKTLLESVLREEPLIPIRR